LSETSKEKVDKEIDELVALVGTLDKQKVPNECPVDVDTELGSYKAESQDKLFPFGEISFKRAFSFKGVMKRDEFAISLLLNFSCILLAVTVVAITLEGIGEFIFFFILLSVSLWSLASSVVKRWRSTSFDFRWLVLLGVPYVNFAIALVIFLAPQKD